MSAQILMESDSSVAIPYVTGTAISRGDLVYRVAASGKITPSSAFTWDTNLATTQTAIHLVFVGVALQGYDGTTAGVTITDGQIRVDPEAVVEFDCASATFKVGDLVGWAKQSGNALENQKVVSVATELLAVGRVYEAVPSNATKVKVKLGPTLMTGLTS